ncbi:MAG: nucleotidyltransferase domain-containing protein [Roseibium album]|uniref:nucleotidyltransferase domain-containing protein n=1 Tax=Roseibium album TaxID=311410 RepID=UPI0032EC9E29
MAISPIKTLAQFPHNVTNISVFGSYARGDNDASSDFDLIVVVKDGFGTVLESVIKERIELLFNLHPSISFYGEKKILDMLQNGHLFAWHLFMESFPVSNFRHISEQFGKPDKYTDFVADCEGLHRILKDTSAKSKSFPENFIFDMGILYVCARNIAMSASSALYDEYYFGRYSPFQMSDIEFPISKEDYTLMMQCRMASTRGMSPPSSLKNTVVDDAKQLTEWSEMVLKRIR